MADADASSVSSATRTRPVSPAPSAAGRAAAPSAADLLRNPEARQREHARILLSDAAAKTARLYAAEMLALGEDYRLLQRQCLLARDKYAGMGQAVRTALEGTHALHASLDAVPEFLKQVDALDAEVAYLESVAAELGEYTKKLEAYAKKVGR
ncbi:hypothetical protein DFJ74DRAFT_647392 [Hyaloraphidium curvatum]|nr:hypothetical protein DFJ74DRAFT_647392 [Hyaloraphidium curvatum]